MADVLVDGVSVGAVTSYTFTNVTANHTIAASFAIDTYTITATRRRQRLHHARPAATTVNYGGNQTFTITPATGYHVADVLVDGVSVGAVTTYTFTNVTANHTIAATFAIDTFTITATPAPTAPSPRRERDRQLRRRPDLHHHPGHRLPRRRRPGGRRLGGRGSQLHLHQRHGQPHHRGHLRHRHLHHHCQRRGQRLHHAAGSDDRQLRRPTRAFTITPATGYHVADVLVDGVSVGAVTSYTFTNVTANHTIAPASPSTPSPSLPAPAPTAPSRPSGAPTVNYGADQTFTITPATGYHVADVLVDGVSVGAVTSYTFTNVTANHTIAASFAIDTYTHHCQRRGQRLHHAGRGHRPSTTGPPAFTITPAPATTWPTSWWTGSRWAR